MGWVRSSGRSKFKGGFPRQGPLADWAKMGPSRKGYCLCLDLIPYPQDQGTLIWGSGVNAAQTGCGLHGFGCCSWLGLWSRLGLGSGLGLYRGLGICSRCWKLIRRSRVYMLVYNKKDCLALIAKFYNSAITSLKICLENSRLKWSHLHCPSRVSSTVTSVP